MNIRKFKWIFAFAGAIAVVLLLRGFAFTSCLIPSTGMENSLFQGERILVNKWSYGLRVPLMSLFSYHRWCERSVRQQDVVVFNNPAAIGQPTIDRREIYISRCIGTPGDTLLVDSLFSVSSPEAQLNPDKKRLYTYPAAKEQLITSLMQTLSITNDGLMGSNDSTHVRSFSRYEYYLLEQAISDQNWIQPLTEKSEKELKPLIVPGKGKALRVYPWNITLLRNTLVMHEGKQAEIKNDTLYIDGKPTQHCFFTKDYYWMASNNSVNLSDSRLFGFVPQDHIIGKASLIWFSKEKGTRIFDGYRWNRFFQSVK
ncbi:signal peptidase I [Bacteroides thetaiotaomicron]|jgi:signal peptidase I|uniref:signal peptidase I n=1 Tax=Bacteroides thetaiotaomicron TaxID=818 RepID=UPI0018A09B91|nr:signal peptidase I [Bacteroides thetaiotaomicron]MDC2132584.1 signal peptidase I [Bacteroides thetaiotaomicron]MDC2137284.1 signal peptidase I [Bacteroides thetaiotaomicron]MDC2141929.1 signal peptidase I [Bacteroides thetaiotaomicron]MDC2144399.1 signal peptidase I [Bacteroides thetaiotaomicron]MDC2151187.1 signal peptidase I [Bacteroides thetaiotaomicron]